MPARPGDARQPGAAPPRSCGGSSRATARTSTPAGSAAASRWPLDIATEGVNRVLLLTDGLANRGRHRHDELAASPTTCAAGGSPRARSASGPTSTRRCSRPWPTAAAGTSTSWVTWRRCATTSPARWGRPSRSSPARWCSRSPLPESVRVEPLSPFRVEQRGRPRARLPGRHACRARCSSVVLRLRFDFGEVGREVGVARRGSRTGTARSRRPCRRADAPSRWPGPTPTTPPTTRSRGTATWTASSHGCSQSVPGRRPSGSTVKAGSPMPRRRWPRSAATSMATRARIPSCATSCASSTPEAPAFLRGDAGDGPQAPPLHGQHARPLAVAGGALDPARLTRRRRSGPATPRNRRARGDPGHGSPRGGRVTSSPTWRNRLH